MSEFKKGDKVKVVVSDRDNIRRGFTVGSVCFVAEDDTETPYVTKEPVTDFKDVDRDIIAFWDCFCETDLELVESGTITISGQDETISAYIDEDKAVKQENDMDLLQGIPARSNRPTPMDLLRRMVTATDDMDDYDVVLLAHSMICRDL